MTHMTEMKSKGSDLDKFWLTYLDLRELLLNLTFATRSGNWELYLTRIEEVIQLGISSRSTQICRIIASLD